MTGGLLACLTLLWGMPFESTRGSSSGPCAPYPWHTFKWIAFASTRPFPPCLANTGMATCVGMQHGARQPIPTRTRKTSGSSGRKLQDEHLKPYTTLGHVIGTHSGRGIFGSADAEINGIPPFRTPTPSLLFSSSITPAYFLHSCLKRILPAF